MKSIIITDKGYKDINPVLLGYQNCSPGHSFGPAIRTHYLIHFVTSGFGKYYVNQKIYNLKPGDMFIIKPFEKTYYEADKINPWNYIWTGFTASTELPIELPYIITCPQAHDIFEKMKRCENISTGRTEYLLARTWDLFALLSEKDSKKDDYTEKALDCIHSEYMNGINVSEIAKRLNLDRKYFSTIFKKKTGVSPMEYLLSHRMNTALYLIKNKGVSVSVAAASVGYSDVYNFSKMFKRFFGESPTSYIIDK